jgi:hypothetical protein
MKVSMELIDNAVRLLNAKYDLGLLDPYKYCDSKELKLIFLRIELNLAV